MESIERRLLLANCLMGVVGLATACGGGGGGEVSTTAPQAQDPPAQQPGPPAPAPAPAPQPSPAPAPAPQPSPAPSPQPSPQPSPPSPPPPSPAPGPSPSAPPPAPVPPPPPAPPPAPLATVWTPARDSAGDVLVSEWERLPLMQWVEVGGVGARLADVLETPYYSTSGGADDRESLTGPWCGAAWDATRKRLIVQGGGHGDGHMCSNGIYEVSLSKAKCVRLVNRSPRSVQQQYNRMTKEFEAWNADGYGYPGGAHPLKDGTPGSVHTYHGLVYIPPATMQRLGYGGNVNGGLMTTMPIAICNLDSGRYNVPYWATYGDGPGAVWETGYQTNNLHGNLVVFPHNYYRHGVIDLTKPSVTRWSAAIGGTPSSCTVTLNVGDGPFVDRVQKVMVKMPERGEYVSIAPPGKSQRVRYGAAVDAGVSDWTRYQDAITLTSSDGSHNDFSAANLDDARGALLCSAGSAYDHATGTIWIQGNIAGSKLYRITGIASNTWTVERLDSVASSYGEQSGIMHNYNRFATGTFGRAKVLMRVTGVDHPIQILRVA